MPTEPARTGPAPDNRRRILEVALEVLGRRPEAGMGEIATAAGVVRRTVYGHFPSRTDLVRTLTEQAVAELVAVLGEVGGTDRAADRAWVDLVGRVWPLARRYRLLLALRRSEHSAEIHALLGPFEDGLAGLVQRGQDDGVFGRHLPAPVLSQLAYSAVFTVAENGLTDETLDARAATLTSLLVLGVPEVGAIALADA